MTAVVDMCLIRKSFITAIHYMQCVAGCTEGGPTGVWAPSAAAEGVGVGAPDGQTATCLAARYAVPPGQVQTHHVLTTRHAERVARLALPHALKRYSMALVRMNFEKSLLSINSYISE